MTKIIACCVMIIMILSSSAAFAEDTHKEEEVIFDAIAVRPVGFITLTIGTVFFIAVLPLAVDRALASAKPTIVDIDTDPRRFL